MNKEKVIRIHFSEFFEVEPEVIEQYGAFNISLLTDLPLFVDPFNLFNSRKKTYHRLHDEIIRYLKFLRDKSRFNLTVDEAIQEVENI